MKKLTKILLGSILSVAMVVTGALAFNNRNDVYAKSSLNVAGYGAITASNGASVEVGTYAQPNTGTLNYNVVVSEHKEFSGVKLTGSTGATFNLGTIDIAKSDWAGTNDSMAATREEVVGDETITHTNKSFLEFVYQPSEMEQSNPWQAEMSEVQFQFTEVGNPNNFLLVDIIPYTDSDKQWREIQIRAKGAGQPNVRCYRYDYADAPTGARKSAILGAYASLLGYPANQKQVVTAVGAQTAPVSLFYDNIDNALFSPVVSEVTTALSKSFLIRDFDENESTELAKKENANATLWNGFTPNAKGEKLVNVTATFISTTKETSIVVTKLGDFDFSKAAETTGNVKNTSATNGASVNYGGAALVGNNKFYNGINLTGGKGASFDLGTINLACTYFDDNWEYLKNTTYPVNAGTTTTYSNISGAFYSGGDASLGTANALASSFFSFVYNPSITTQMELKKFSVTIREVDDLTTLEDESLNFVTYVINGVGWTSAGNMQTELNELNINCMATNNSNCTAERFYKTGITFANGIRRQIDCRGSQSRPIGLYYDVSQNAAYTDVAYSGKIDGIYGAFRIRDFDDVEKKASDYAGSSATIKNWNGFSKADANVTVTVTFDDVIETDTTSLIVTSFGGKNYTTQELTFDEKVAIKKGTTVNLNDFAGYKMSSITLKYENGPIAGYSVNGGEIFTDSSYTFDGEAPYTVNFYDANNTLLGSTEVEYPTILFGGVSLDNGSWVIERDGVEQTIDNQTNFLQEGDVLKLIPNNRAISNLPLSDLRLFAINGLNYNYNVEEEHNGDGIPAVWNEEGGYYTVTVSDATLKNFSFKVVATFDRCCRITVQDEYVEDKISHVWTNTDLFSLGSTSGEVMTYGAMRYGKSGGEKILVAYVRKDLGKNYETGETVIREDGFTYDYNEDGLIYYSGTALNNAGSVNANITKAYCIVPNMVFEALYVDFNVRTEIKLATGANNEVDERFTGLRFVVEVEKEDWNKLKFYSKETNEEGNSDIVFRNYITTESQLTNSGKDINNALSFGTNWMAGNWEPTFGKVNGLGLTCVSWNGVSYDASKVEGATGGFIYYGLAETKGEMWLDDDKNINNKTHYAYALTVRNFKDNTQTYLLSVLCSVGYVRGGNTGIIKVPVTVNLAEECGKKYNNVLASATDSATGVNVYKVTIDGVDKYISITPAHLQWLKDKSVVEEEPSVEA